MWVRDAWTALTLPQQEATLTLGDVVEDAAAGIPLTGDPDEDLSLQELHALAQLMVQQRAIFEAELSHVSDADAVVDWEAMETAAANMVEVKRYMVQISAERGATNPYALSWIDNTLLAVGTWAQGTMHQLVGAPSAVIGYVTTLGQQVVTGTGAVLSAATTSALKALVPVFLLGGVVLYGVRQAERTRTYRRYVA
jgi:hypothetical protein